MNCHPDWQFGKSGQLCFEELMDMQDRMVENHPQTTFIIAHFGSYAENLKHVALRLDRYDNMYVDMAARVAELGECPIPVKHSLKSIQNVLYSERIAVRWIWDSIPFITGFWKLWMNIFHISQMASFQDRGDGESMESVYRMKFCEKSIIRMHVVL